MEYITKNGYQLHVCDDHTGKMEGLMSLSTSCKENRFCKARMNIEGCICEHCFADEMQDNYTALHDVNARNTMILSTVEFHDGDFVGITGDDENFRLESFGDTNNVAQAKNYLIIAHDNPSCNVTLWTKNYNFIIQAMKQYGKPANFHLGFSSPFLNKIKFFDVVAPEDQKYFDFVFTVYTAGYVRRHNININCGARSCVNTCHLKCYHARNTGDGPVIVNELLKGDKVKYRLRDPEMAELAIIDQNTKRKNVLIKAGGVITEDKLIKKVEKCYGVAAVPEDIMINLYMLY